MKVTRHAPPDMADVRDSIQFDTGLIEQTRQAIRRDPGLLGQLQRMAGELTALLWVAEGDVAQLCRPLRTASHALVAMFRLAAATTGEVDVVLDEESCRLPASGPTSETFAGNWRHAFYLAAIRRDKAALDALCQVPVDVLRRSSTRVDECALAFSGALQSYWRGEAGAPERLLAALELTDPAQLKVDPDYALYVLVPEIDAMYRLLLRDAEGFNQAVAKGLDAHKKYWSRAARKRSPLGFIAWGLVAIGALAHESGLSLQVDSDYLPKGLLRGECR